MQLRLIPLLVLVPAAALAGAAGGTPQPGAELTAEKKRPKRVDLKTSKHLWATINVCDTAAHENTVGVRGSMPGLGHKPSKQQMRFQVQYRTDDGDWRHAGEDADSGWQNVGRTVRQRVESGQNFTFVPPDEGAHRLRGVVRFRWLKRGETVAYQLRLTEAGHKTTAGADPKGYSASSCSITAP